MAATDPLLSPQPSNSTGSSYTISDSLLDEYKEKPDPALYSEDGSVDIHGNPSLKSASGGWKACRFILANECCERLAYYGITMNMVTYMTTVLYLGNATAASSINSWAGTCYITPFIGAFIADAFWGRYWTIAVFSFIYFVGMVLLTLCASIPALKPTSEATAIQLSVFYTSLYLIALGTGGIKPCVSSFGADQFDSNDVLECKKMSSFFNWYYFSINIGALIASTVLVYIQENYSWAWGFGIPAIAMGIAICSFVFGSPLYRYQKVGSSPIIRMLQVCVAAYKKRKEKVVPDDLYETEVSSIVGSRKLEHTDVLTCFDKAAIVTENEVPSLVSKWRLCTVTQVEELKLILGLLPIGATTIVFSAVYAQMSTLFVEQGSTMDRSVGNILEIPAASLSMFDTLSVIVWVPIYDVLIIPIARRFTGHQLGFSQLQRMGIGLIISMLAMVVAAFVEMKRLETAKEYGLLEDTDTPVPMSVFWQVPQYVLIGASEVFTFIGQLEFYYDQSPDATRSLCAAIALLSTALGSYLSAFILFVITSVTGDPGWIPDNLNIGHIDYVFWLLAGLSLLNFFFFLAFARSYTYKKVGKA